MWGKWMERINNLWWFWAIMEEDVTEWELKREIKNKTSKPQDDELKVIDPVSHKPPVFRLHMDVSLKSKTQKMRQFNPAKLALP